MMHSSTDSSSSTVLPNKAQYGPAILTGPPSTSSRRRSTPDSGVEKMSASSSVPSNLGLKLIGDAVVGTGVTFTLAPFLTIVDKAIAQRAAGTTTLMHSSMQSLKQLVASPVSFARNPAFLYVWAVYASTYSAANSLKTLVEHQEQKHSSSKRHASNTKSGDSIDPASFGKVGIFLGTSMVNMGASITKDRAFARMFSPDTAASAVAKQVPKASYGLWVTRDLIGVGSSFVLPEMVARKLSENNPQNEKRNRDLSQFCVPVATQLIAGPLHLLGLDLFNRPMQELSMKNMIMERSKFLASGYTAVVGARIARIIPGYGFGGVMNTNLRDGWRDYLVEKEAHGEPLSLPHLGGVTTSAPLSDRLQGFMEDFVEATLQTTAMQTTTLERQYL